MHCPSCGNENLEGADACDVCETSLVAFGIPAPTAGLQKQILTDPISKISVRETVCIKPSTSVQIAIRQMKEKKVGCALVIEQAQLLGIFTERDVLAKLAKPGIELADIEVQNVMTASPELLEENHSIAYALNKMALGNFRHVPFRRADGTHAILSVRDVLRHFF